MGTNNGGNEILTVKITINLNKYYKDQLELFVKMNQISSITEGINAALESYVKTMKKAIYEEQMKTAANDRDYIERTVLSQNDFDHMDNDDALLEAEEW